MVGGMPFFNHFYYNNVFSTLYCNIFCEEKKCFLITVYKNNWKPTSRFSQVLKGKLEKTKKTTTNRTLTSAIINTCKLNSLQISTVGAVSVHSPEITSLWGLFADRCIVIANFHQIYPLMTTTCTFHNTDDQSVVVGAWLRYNC